jgi:1,4-dihydroxy-2-naphthoyl-CoA synthase
MQFNTITYDNSQDGIGRITLNRPERLNAINLEILTSVYPVANWEALIFCQNSSAMHGQPIFY